MCLNFSFGMRFDGGGFGGGVPGEGFRGVHARFRHNPDD